MRVKTMRPIFVVLALLLAACSAESDPSKVSSGTGGSGGTGGSAGAGGSAGTGGASGSGGTGAVAAWNAVACGESAATCSGQKAPCCEKAATSLAVRDSHGYCGTFEDSCGNDWKCDTCEPGDECLPDPVDSLRRLGCYTPCTQRASCPEGYCGTAQTSCWTCPREPAQDYISTWARNKLQPTGCTLGGGLNGNEEIWCCQ